MKHLVLLLFLFSTTLVAQQEGSIVLSSNTFTSREGYLISNPFDAKYDSDGWLWILGENRGSNPYLFSDKEIIIQRFDGANFFTLKIPNSSDRKIKNGLFFQHEKGMYLKLIYKASRAQLFYIDTQTLEFTPVDPYNNLKTSYAISKEYQVGDTTRLLITSKSKVYSAAIDRLQLKFIDSIALDRPMDQPFLTDVISADGYSIVKLSSNNELLLLDSRGKIKKKLSRSDFVNTKGEYFYPHDIQQFLKVNNQDYYYLECYENIFKYQNGKFKEVPSTGDHSQVNRELIFNTDFTNAYLKKIVGDYSEFKLYNFKGFKPELLATIEFKNFSKTAYKKLGKDLVILNGEKLTAYVFNNTRVKTFLKGKSVRAIKQLGNSTYIVSTDNEGFYLIDVEADTTKKIDFSLKGKEFSIKQAGDILIEEDGKFVIGGENNLYTINSNFEIIKDQRVENTGQELIKIKDTIFTVGKSGFIYKYNSRENKHTAIPNTDTFQVKEFATDGETLYATTSSGIFEYKNSVFKIHRIENEDIKNLLSINYSDNYGVLVSTKLGELYSFNSTTKKLDLIYEDQFNASIVGMVEDDDKNLWLNTHAGVVSFNPSSKKVTRYGLKDGIYELEGNQYSTYKDPEGNILMGSSKGLSFFNKRKLSKNKIEVQPRFSSISFFNSEEGRWEINTSPQFLKNTKEIILPSEYRRFSVHASVFESFSSQDLNYRFRLLDEKMNTEWYATYPGKELLYANLAPGKYTLQFEALDSSNNKLGETLELTVISEEVFYKTWWFITFILLTITGVLVYLFHLYKTKQDLILKNEIALNEASVKNNMMLEIHHRIKNNLQIVSGFLEMQMADSDDAFLKSALENSQGRIASIAGIHDLLYNTDNENTVVVKENVESIITYYKKLFLFGIKYQVDIDSSIMSIDQITPFSILFNELISNSNKHAFDKIEDPIITIRFYKKEDMYFFEYFDNGNFKKEDIKANTMGMRIVAMMNKQLKGTLKINKDNHFHLTMFFPVNG